MKYKKRFISDRLWEYLKIFPVVTLTGARQTGKSTLLRHLFTEGWTYYSLDERGLLEDIRRDPDLFVKNQKTNTIFDEAQKLPELFHSIKYAVDSGFQYKIILSGSANFLLLSKVTETLAGRTGVLELYPFCHAEIEEVTEPRFFYDIWSGKGIDEIVTRHGRNNTDTKVIRNRIFTGGYPKALEFPDRERAIWFENYRSTYLERDLRDLSQIADIGNFQKFYEMLAYQSGSIVNLTGIGSDIGITTNTSKKYLSILLTSYQFFLLRPFYANIHKRLVKKPKIYAGDTGFANFLLRHRNADEMEKSGRYGSMFENWVITEIWKHNSFMDDRFNMYFWRTSNGAEVDLIIERGKTIVPVEIKSAARIQKEHLRGLNIFIGELSKKYNIPFGLLLYGGERIVRLSEKVLALPVGCIL